MSRVKSVWNLVIIFVFVCIAGNVANGQSSFKAGYYVDGAGDTIRAQIEHIDYLGKIESVQIKNSGKDITLYPNDIQGFGYPGDRYYRSGITPNSFVELIVDGKLSLMREQFTYYFTKEGDTSIYEITNNREIVDRNGKPVERQETKWKGLVYYLISDCNPANVTAKQIGITENYLRKLTIRYNECSGDSYTEYKEAVPETVVKFGINAGAYAQNQEIFLLGRNKIEDNKATDLFIGGVVDIHLPKFSNRLHFLTGINYYQGNSTIESYYGANEYRRITGLETAAIQIPIIVQYRIEKNQWYLGIEAGLGLHAYTKILYTQYSERIIDGVWEETNRLEDKELDASTFLYGYGGLSIGTTIGQIESGISLRYNQQLFYRWNAEYYKVYGFQLGGFVKF